MKAVLPGRKPQKKKEMQQQTFDFREILSTYQGKVYNQAYRMLGNREEAEEATQDIFLRIHRSLEEFRGESKLSSWIFRITANVCITRLRKKQLSLKSLDEPVDEGGRSADEIIADESTDQEAEYETKELGEIVRAEVRRLPANWAQALSLNYFGGLSYEEVAETMEIPRATVATYILRGKKQLAVQIIARVGMEGLKNLKF